MRCPTPTAKSIRQHLDECGPCLREFGLEEVVKKLVAKHCGCDPGPRRTAQQSAGPHRQVQAEIEGLAEWPTEFVPVDERD